MAQHEKKYLGPILPTPQAFLRRHYGREEHARLRFYSSQDDFESEDWVFGEKLDGKLASFLHYASLPAAKPSFNLIACHSGSPDGLISISEQQVKQIETDGKLPLSRLALFEENGQYAHYVEYEGNLPSTLCIIFQAPESFIHNISCCIRIRIQDHSVLAVYFDKNEERLLCILKLLKELLGHPALAPFQFISILLESYSSATEQWRRIVDRGVRLTEGETGARSQTMEFEPDRVAEHNFARLNLGMHHCSSKLVSLEHVVDWQLMTWNFVLEMVSLYSQLRLHSELSQSSDSMLCGITQNAINQIRACKLQRSRILGAQKAIQSQISMVFSLISQRDNRATIQLANDSRSITAAAKRDSKVMKVIAVLTLVFLPSTLIATIFSSGVFVIGEVNEGASRVSPLWWIYALASVLSTAVVLIASIVFLRLNGSRDASPSFNLGKQNRTARPLSSTIRS